MQYNPARTLSVVFTFVFLFFIPACAYFENDNAKYQITIVGNIQIVKQENSTVNNLVFAKTSEIFAVMVEDCKSVYYDTASNLLFADSYLNETNRNYYQIYILDAFSKKVLHGIKKDRINETDFIQKTKNLPKKWYFDE